MLAAILASLAASTRELRELLGCLPPAVTLAGGRVELEVSGNVTEDTLLPLAQTGVDYISIGSYNFV